MEFNLVAVWGTAELRDAYGLKAGPGQTEAGGNITGDLMLACQTSEFKIIVRSLAILGVYEFVYTGE